MITISVLTVKVWGKSLSLPLTIKTLVPVPSQLHMYCSNHFLSVLHFQFFQTIHF